MCRRCFPETRGARPRSGTSPTCRCRVLHGRRVQVRPTAMHGPSHGILNGSLACGADTSQADSATRRSSGSRPPRLSHGGLRVRYIREAMVLGMLSRQMWRGQFRSLNRQKTRSLSQLRKMARCFALRKKKTFRRLYARPWGFLQMLGCGGSPTVRS